MILYCIHRSPIHCSQVQIDNINYMEAKLNLLI